MSQGERRAWLIVAVTFLNVFLISGTQFAVAGIFFPFLLKYFGWTHAKLSLLQSVLGLMSGLGAPVAGWALDRTGGKIVITVGVLLAAAGFLLASQANSFQFMLVAFIVQGLGAAAAGITATAYLVSNWFEKNRGLALTLAFSGMSLGGTVMAPVALATINWAGWRVGYAMLSLPVLLILLPLNLIIVRRPHAPPPGQSKAELTRLSAATPGLEVSEALRGRSFWLVGCAYLGYGLIATGTITHLVPYLIQSGFTAARAAATFSAMLFLGGCCKPLFGLLADRVGARIAMWLDFTGFILGYVALIGIGHCLAPMVFVATMGPAWGAPSALGPILLVETCGLRRYGTLAGLLGFFSTVGGTLGPWMGGAIFDWTGSYVPALQLFIAILIVAGFSLTGCLPLSAVRLREGAVAQARAAQA
jgi:MFS family permease